MNSRPPILYLSADRVDDFLWLLRENAEPWEDTSWRLFPTYRIRCETAKPRFRLAKRSLSGGMVLTLEGAIEISGDRAQIKWTVRSPAFKWTVIAWFSVVWLGCLAWFLLGKDETGAPHPIAPVFIASFLTFIGSAGFVMHSFLNGEQFVQLENYVAEIAMKATRSSGLPDSTV
jgi:hypothetical protein